MKKIALCAGIIASLAIGGFASAKGGGSAAGVYKVSISHSAEFTYYRARINADQQFGVSLEERLQKGAIIEVCKDGQTKGDTCRYIVPALPAPKTYTVYDTHTNPGAFGWGLRHQLTLRDAHDQGLAYRVCPVAFVQSPTIRPDCKTY